jgi:hypothetical protein
MSTSRNAGTVPNVFVTDRGSLGQEKPEKDDTMRSNHWLRFIALAAVAAATAACSSGSSENTPQETTLSISLMDAAVDDVTEVNVEIAAIWLKPAGDGPAVQLPLTQTPITVDLLAHSSDNAAILVDEAVIEPGSYEWLRMDVNAEFDNVFDSFVKTSTGGMEEIRVPSGRVRLVSGFDVAASQGALFLFDWDLRRGLVHPRGQPGYFLKPAFRMVDVTEFGELHGSIAAATVTDPANDCNADSPAADFAVGNSVYVYAGLDVEPHDIDGGGVEPITTIDAVDEDNDGDYEYRTLLEPGDYTIAFTCQAANDLAESSETGNADPTLDTVEFVTSVNQPIAGDSVEVDF